MSVLVATVYLCRESAATWVAKANLKGLQYALTATFSKGLEHFMPEQKLCPGKPFALLPPSVEERPLLTAVPCLVQDRGIATLCHLSLSQSLCCFFFFLSLSLYLSLSLSLSLSASLLIFIESIPAVKSNIQSEVADEDMLPYKSMYALMTAGARIWVEPESLHCLWNTAKAAFKRSGLQGAVLLGSLMTQVNHGPYASGANMLTKQEAMEHRIGHLTDDEWEILREDIAMDRLDFVDDLPGVDADEELASDVPMSKEELLEAPSVSTRGLFDA